MPTLAETWFNEGHEQGVAQGIQQGNLSTAHKNLVDILETRFHVVPVSVTTRIDELDDPDRLNRLIKMAVVVDSLAEFEKLLISTHH
ncbi:MAG: hypothetical protein HQK60_03635 [Deltaproteobacteria bacterium]|nr:hypothetical protein [Deltaproteobacteria bacterium]